MNFHIMLNLIQHSNNLTIIILIEITHPLYASWSNFSIYFVTLKDMPLDYWTSTIEKNQSCGRCNGTMLMMMRVDDGKDVKNQIKWKLKGHKNNFFSLKQ